MQQRHGDEVFMLFRYESKDKQLTGVNGEAQLAENVDMEIRLRPGDAQWKRVDAAGGGRVYALEMKATTVMFWMSSKSSARDAEHAETMNRFLGKLDADARRADEMVDMGDVPMIIGMQDDDEDEDEHEQQKREAKQLANMLAGIARDAAIGGTGTGTGTETGTASGRGGGFDIDAVTAAIQRAAAAVLGTASPSTMGREELSLMDVLTPGESVLALLDDDEIVARLIQHLPESQRSTEDIKRHLCSPQLRQQAEAFAKLLRTGHIEWVQLGIAAPQHNPMRHAPTSVTELLLELDAQQQRELQQKHVATKGDPDVGKGGSNGGGGGSGGSE